MNRRTSLLAVLTLAAVSGCGGPQRDLEVGFKEVPSDVVLGRPATSLTSPTPGPGIPGMPQPPPPAVVALPPPSFETGGPPTDSDGPAPAPPLACPQVDPLQAPALEAPSGIGAPPRPASYVFRNTGTFAVSGAEPRSGRFPAESRRRVGGIQRLGPSEFTYDVAEVLGEVTTTTTYHVVQASDVPGAAGVFLRSVRSTGPDGAEPPFTPLPEPRLVALPLVRGAASDERGVDATTATSMSFRSTVMGKARVDACGLPLDTWTIRLSEGRLLSPDTDLEFEATLSLGTQYGGLFVSEVLGFAGTSDGVGISRSNLAIINSEPLSILTTRP